MVLNVKTCLRQRYVFAIMGFFASVIMYMIRMSVQLTIAHMVNETISSPPTQFDPNSCPHILVNQSDEVTIINEKQGPLDWDASTQQSVVSIYRTAYIITQFLGGMVADRAGGKSLLLFSMLLSSLATIFIPLTAMLLGSTGVVVLRFITGLTGGTIIPTQLSMMSKWVPADERAFVASIIFPGILVGRVAASYMAEPLILLAGWQIVYYVFGIIGLIWVVVWKYTCYSTPNEHPNISANEKAYLNSTTVSLIRTTKYDLDQRFQGKGLGRVFCPAVLSGLVFLDIREWAFAMLTTQIPQFLRDVLRFDITGSHLEYLPYLGLWIFALIFGFTSDVLVARGCCSLKFIRQITTSIGAIISSLCIIIIAYSGCNTVLAIFFMFIGMLVLGAYYSGAMINMLDLNPNYAGTMIGVADNVAINSVVILSSLHGLIVSDALLSQWRILIWVVSCVIIFASVICIYFMKAEQMWWDDVRQLGYPSNWKRGRFSAEAEIDENGKTVIKLREIENRRGETTEETPL